MTWRMIWHVNSKERVLREFNIGLVGKRREDGSMFVTSPNMKPFSAVLYDGRWESVLPYLRKFLEVNFGEVRGLRLIHDACELRFDDTEQPETSPAYVIVGLTSQRVHTT
jgi:hypothetical protein